MKLENFSSKLFRDVFDFERYWKKKNQSNYEEYPSEQSLPEWQEQFDLFLDQKAEKKTLDD
jgi:hypothetical protein